MLEIENPWRGGSGPVLARQYFENDSLGRRGTMQRQYPGRRYTPCVEADSKLDVRIVLDGVRQLILRNERVPFDSTELIAKCVDYGWARAFLLADSQPLPWIAEQTAWQLLSVHATQRARALARFDSALAIAIARGDSAVARDALIPLADEMWTRAQARLERPLRDVQAEEERVHNLAAGVATLRALAAIPATSRALGESEAEWSARLYTQIAQLTSGPGRSQWLRLALAPWVAMSRWNALDSAASAMLRWAPGDSALVLAGPLAAYHLANGNVSRLLEAEAAFENASRHLPRVDSARFSDFDDVLTREDDEWRYGFLPSERLAIDRRGWLVIDPMWSTRVNEVQLARRARMAEADYRYAQVALSGQSGSETPSGRIHMRRGAPSERWVRTYVGRADTFRHYRRTWHGLTQDMKVEDRVQWWRAFAGGRQRAALLGLWSVKQRSCLDPRSKNAAFRCVERERATWNGVPFIGRMDTVDVMLARFRGGADSIDLHVEARVPLRNFPYRGMKDVQADSRIATTLFLRQPLGEPIATLSHSDALPPKDQVALYHQWQTRVGPEDVFHRVEAYEPLRSGAARGVMHFNTDAAIRIDVRGFGLSDVLLTGNAVEKVRPAVRWSDFAFAPNAGVVLPRERFSVLWEIYDLTPDADGRVRWRVDVRRQVGDVVNTGDIRDALTAGKKADAKVLANEPDASSLSYEREDSARPAIVEHIKMPLQANVPYGRHVVTVTVTDLVSGRSATRSTNARLLVPSQQRRLEQTGPVLPFR